MVVSYGMSKKLGIIDYAGGKESFDRRYSVQPRGEYSETTAALIDEEIRNIVSTEYERAKNVLKANREKLDAISKELSSIEKMSGERFMELMK
jgi:cell division protease FtsH